MTSPAPEVDVEDLVIAYLSPLVATGACAARVPASPPLPFILVQRVAGGDDYVWDHSTISVHSIADSQTAASDLARQAHHLMRSIHPQDAIWVGGQAVTVNHVEIEQTSIFVDWQDPILMRYVGRYRIDVRLPAIPNF